MIAVPLLQKMKADAIRIAELNQVDPTATKNYNAALEYDPDYPGGPAAAHAATLLLVEDAKEKALKAAKKRLAAAKTDEVKTREETRLAALEVAVKEQVVNAPFRGKPFSLARLHASVIRRTTAANRAQSRPPIMLIHPERFEVIIDLNLERRGGRAAARQWVVDNIERAKAAADVRDSGQLVHYEKDQPNSQYLFVRLEGRAISMLVDLDMADAKAAADALREMTENPVLQRQIDERTFRAIFHIWPDFEVSASIFKSISTVKCDAAQNSFAAHGTGITWAVMDSGIKYDHPHFRKFANVDPDSTLHRDFTVDGGDPFNDENGHGTHVAGIIAGEWRVALDTPEDQRPLAVSRSLKRHSDDVENTQTRLEAVSGMAPRCKLVSLRVLDENGKGAVSNLIAAINHVQEINGYGRHLIIHGVNMSLGYNFEPEWFACGQSPLCTEVDRLVKTGVVVVVAAGNTGYGTLKSAIGGTTAGMALTINDPGNADLAITVGSTHRDSPHVYGVSYFSSKGPTGDGRLKPDLVAPGEKIMSCAAGALMEDVLGKDPEQGIKTCDYVETSGTSMAAPHVSGAIAAFLSVRGEYIGKAELVKQIFVSTSTDLRRDKYFQGAGLVDLMRAIQSV
ncbi:MAG: S8 family peptidase [Gemmatimonadaceae bacterium]